VTVILGPLSERHVEHIFGIIHGTNGSFRGTKVIFGVQASFAPFYDQVQLRCDDKVPTNGDCFMTPKGAQGQRSPLNSPPPLRRPSAFSHISIIPPTSMHIPEHFDVPGFLTLSP
jgi:hypothetical protein